MYVCIYKEETQKELLMGEMMYIFVYICIYMYIDSEVEPQEELLTGEMRYLRSRKERIKRERFSRMHTYIQIYIYTHIYVYINIGIYVICKVNV
jgi:hypothetical protein